MRLAWHSLCKIQTFRNLRGFLAALSRLTEKILNGNFIGPRKEMITPWSTNAVEITQTMGIQGIQRIEEFKIVSAADVKYDRMLEVLYTST